MRWRPRDRIRVIAIALIRREGRLLAAEVRGDDGAVKGLRPLGGAVEFGETWRDALSRELHEELGLDLRPLGEPLVLENLFRHEGAPGHEIVFAAAVPVPDGALPFPGPVTFREDDGSAHRAVWVDPQATPDGVPLYPEGLAARLRAFDPAPGP